MTSLLPERSQLVALLALQMAFISREQWTAANSVWQGNSSHTLDEVLVEQGALRETDRQLLLPLVERLLEQPAEIATASLKSMISTLGLEQEPLFSAAPAAASPAATLPWSPAPGEAPSVDATGSAAIRFQILRPHAKGGLGEVSVARDLELNRDVALKEIQARFASDPSSQARFLLEAEVTGGLEHPGIVPVYGLGRHADGRPYYAMRFIRGDSLQVAADRFHSRDKVEPGSATSNKAVGTAPRIRRTRVSPVARPFRRRLSGRSLRPQPGSAAS